jgi:hypothetical protein
MWSNFVGHCANARVIVLMLLDRNRNCRVRDCTNDSVPSGPYFSDLLRNGIS